MSPSTQPSIRADIESLSAEARYDVLCQIEPTDIPNFRFRHTQTHDGRTYTDTESCISQSPYILEVGSWRFAYQRTKHLMV